MTTAIERDDTEEMAKYGITRVPIDHFHFRGFRYTNLDDAIAQAKRELAARPSNQSQRTRAG